MGLNVLVVSNIVNSQSNIILSNVSDDENKFILKKLEENKTSLYEKNELLLPLLDIQKYVFIYKINTDSDPLIFCIIADKEDHNSFFTEIPYIKFKSQQCKVLYDSHVLMDVHDETLNWFTSYNYNQYDPLHMYPNLIVDHKDSNILRNLINNANTILELFQNKATDSSKTKTIEAIKKSSGIEDFQLTLKIAKLINKDIENIVAPFLKMEKKYSSFLSDF